MINISYKMAAIGGIFCVLLFLAASAFAHDDIGEFDVLHSPEYVNFLRTDDTIDANEVPSVIAAYLGLPLTSDIKWKGLLEGSPFRRPKAAVVLSVSSLPNGKLKASHQYKYPVLESVNDFDSEGLVNYIQSQDWKKEPTFVDLSVDMSVVTLRSHRPDLFKDLPSTLGKIYEDGIVREKWFQTSDLGSLNISNDADLQFTAELYIINEVIGLLKRNSKILNSHSPDFFHFKINGLAVLADAYGKHSPQLHDALRLLKTTVEQVTKEFRELYHDNCVIQLIGFRPMTDEKRFRQGRSLLGVEANSSRTLNLAPEFSDMYPVTFHIILWTMIAMALAIFAISWGIWNMDPGRDSLIYRMSSQRKKND